MAADIQLLPGGELILPPGSELPQKIVTGFKMGNGAGVLALTTSRLEGAIAPGIAFWRSFGNAYLTSLCHSPPNHFISGWKPVPTPSEEQLLAQIAAAPPSQGMEYLSVQNLEEIWRAIDNFVCSETSKGLHIEAWLQKHNPLWRFVGRVTFHLAENKRSEKFPFAFLATYTHRLSSQSNLQYLPLGKAVKKYAGEKDARVLTSLLQPIQNAAERNDFARSLLDSRRVFQALAWTPDDAYNFLEAIPDFEAAGVIAKVPDWWKDGRPSRPKVSVKLDSKDISMGGLKEMLSFQAVATLENEPLAKEDWKKLVSATSGLVSIKGQWVEVDSKKLREAMEQWRKVERAAEAGLVTFAEGMRMLAGFYQGSFALRELGDALEGTRGWTSFEAQGELLKILQQIRRPADITDSLAPSIELKADLRPYQREGFNWLCFMSKLGLGACLADDMGLGKTIQIISILLEFKRHQSPPSLLVVPASLIGNWKAELEKFAPTLSVFFAHPSQTPSDQIEKANFGLFDAIVTTYNMLPRVSSIHEVCWNTLILDEAQAIKNPATSQTKAVKSLHAQQRIALTGTPIENNLTDLWSLFDFLNPGLLGSASQFKQALKSMDQDGIGYTPLKKLVSPYILRRLKTDKAIIADLPEKTEVNAHCPLTKSQAAVYQSNVKQLAEDLMTLEKGDIQRKGLVLSYLMRFKQICNHPGLVTGSGNFDLKHSGKFQRLQTIADEIASRGEKMLVFTQFREMTGPLAELLQSVFRLPGLSLHGGTQVKQRQKLVDQFQQPEGPSFFVISLKAGGTGLNLTAASHVVHFDRWWNPAVENQATDRAFRIGQKRNVLVHKFVCPGTIEAKIDQLIATKQKLADEVIGQDGPPQMLSEMSDDELLQFVSIDLNAAVF